MEEERVVYVLNTPERKERWERVVAHVQKSHAFRVGKTNVLDWALDFIDRHITDIHIRENQNDK